MKKFFALILALAMALSLVACGGGTDNGDGGSNGGATTKMRFVTGGESGTYYAFGSVIAQHATNNAGIDVVGLVGNGSQSNVQELQDGNAELAFCQSDVMAYAYNGTNIFADHGKVDCFSTVAARTWSRCRSSPSTPPSRPWRIWPVRRSPWALPVPACTSTPRIS